MAGRGGWNKTNAGGGKDLTFDRASHCECCFPPVPIPIPFYSCSRFAVHTLRGALSVFCVVLINGMSVWIVCRLPEGQPSVAQSEERSQVSYQALHPLL